MCAGQQRNHEEVATTGDDEYQSQTAKNERSQSPPMDPADLSAPESVALWRAILRTAADPVIIIDEHGIMLKANQATRTLFGYLEEELVGQNVSMLMPEPYRNEHDGYIANYLQTGETKIIGIGREVEAMKADGTVFPMALAVSEVQTESGRMFTGMIHDLTDRRDAERQLKEANERLEQRVAERTRELEASMVELSRSNRDLEQFAYVASHDLQAPLRNVRQGLELLDEHMADTIGQRFDDEARELQGHIVGAVGNMEELIHGLLTYARVDRGEATTVDLNNVFNHVVGLLQVDIERSGASITAGELPTVNGNETQLRQLLQNLLNNAIQYRSPERPPKITVESAAHNDDWLVTVTDNGAGVDAEQHGRIFELFRRGSNRKGGVGLGLAICQRIVERHGGTIWVESKPDEGASFHFTLASTQPEVQM